MNETTVRRALAIGAGAGLALALSTLLSGGSGPGEALPDNVVARVNERLIGAEEFERARDALAADRRTPLTQEDERRVLERLVDEELLVQYGLELGLARHDRRVRRELVSAVMSAELALAETGEPEEAELRAFFDENRDLFATPGRLHVRSLWIGLRTGEAADLQKKRAREAVERLRRGEGLTEVRRAFGDPEAAPVPDTPLPPAKVREYLGPAALKTLALAEPGTVIDPLRRGRGYQILILVDRAPGDTPSLESLRDEVVREWERRQADRALREKLEELRRRGTVELVEIQS